MRSAAPTRSKSAPSSRRSRRPRPPSPWPSPTSSRARSWPLKEGACAPGETLYGSKAQATFCLSPKEVGKLPFTTAPNPQNPTYARLRLVLVSDLARAAKAKHGSAEALAQHLAKGEGGSVAQRCSFLAGGSEKAPGSKTFARDFTRFSFGPSLRARFLEEQRASEAFEREQARKEAKFAPRRAEMERQGMNCECHSDFDCCEYCRFVFWED
jgi:hypothetical protein